MKIIAIIKNGDEKRQLRVLSEKGHDVIAINNTEGVRAIDADVIVSLSESTVEDAFNLSQRYNIPFYAHIDWIPPWMVFKESEHEWGYIDKIPFHKKMNFIRKYQNLAMYWSMADVKSMSATCFHSLMRDLVGIMDMSIYTRHPLPDVEEAIRHKTNKRKNQITCVSRFIPHKRIHHLIKALQMIEYDGVLKLVGEGEDKNLYEAMKGDLDIEYVNTIDKYKTIAESRLVVCLWNGTVPAESLLVDVPVVAYDNEYIREIYGNNLFYVKNNSISGLARGIQSAFKNDSITPYHCEEDVLEKLITKAVRR